MNTIEVMSKKGINLFDTVRYEHNTGVYTCILIKIRRGGVILRTPDNRDKPFFVYGDGLDNITKP